MDIHDVLDALAIHGDDRVDCLALYTDRRDDADVAQTVAAITRGFGTFDEVPVELPTRHPLTWLTAYLVLTPAVIQWHRDRGIPERVTADTLADVGRHVALSRRVTGEFGLQTWEWLLHHVTARIFALGRLQFALQRADAAIPGAVAAGDWVLAAHIPETGPLLPALVDESLAAARTFFDQHFPDHPVAAVTCDSWMLDPYLLERMPPSSNVGAFIRRFTPFGELADGPTEALYFVFRTRDTGRVGTLPRETSLQRAVLDRFESGQTWQTARGYLLLPPGGAPG